jgi:hypothetical protein
MGLTRTVTEFGGVVPPPAAAESLLARPGAAPPRLVVGWRRDSSFSSTPGPDDQFGPERVINLGLGIMDAVGGGPTRNTPPALSELAIIAGETGGCGRYGSPAIRGR